MDGWYGAEDVYIYIYMMGLYFEIVQPTKPESSIRCISYSLFTIEDRSLY